MNTASLKRKAGPLPVWAWLVLGAVGAYLLYRRYAGGSKGALGDTAVNGLPYIPSGNQSGSGLGESGGLGVPPPTLTSQMDAVGDSGSSAAGSASTSTSTPSTSDAATSPAAAVYSAYVAAGSPPASSAASAVYSAYTPPPAYNPVTAPPRARVSDK